MEKKNYVLPQVRTDWDKETLDLVGNQWFREVQVDLIRNFCLKMIQNNLIVIFKMQKYINRK